MKRAVPQAGTPRRIAARPRKSVIPCDELDQVRARILAGASEVRILDPGLSREYIRQRQERGLDQYDEVWEGVYVVPPLANNPHQSLATALASILFYVINLENRGQAQAGANVSDRRDGWEHNYRDPDVVVVLNEGRAVDCGTHWMGGPDFLIEVQSPRDDTEEKIPFYSELQVRELLVIHRDTRHLRLFRHDGEQLTLVAESDPRGRCWLKSEVVPLSFRRKPGRGNPQVEVRRTDGQPGKWLL